MNFARKLLTTNQLMCLYNTNKKLLCPLIEIRRCYPALPKRFYRKTGVLYSDGFFEVCLDQRKLKTPRGNPFKVESEPLALAVAAEWDSQKQTIRRNNMHLTALCSTVIDNPNNITKYDLVQSIVSFLDTDTVLFQSEEEELHRLQQKEWGHIIDWFCKRFDVDIKPTQSLGLADISRDVISTIERYLLSYNVASVHGIMFAVEALKSVILTVACIERQISVEKAVLLARLEEEYQSGFWGRVEWSHDINQLDLQSRVAAAVLFVYLNSSSEHTKSKDSGVPKFVL